MCLYLIEQGGDRGILDANSRGYIPAEVTSNKDIGKLNIYWKIFCVVNILTCMYMYIE